MSWWSRGTIVVVILPIGAPKKKDSITDQNRFIHFLLNFKQLPMSTARWKEKQQVDGSFGCGVYFFIMCPGRGAARASKRLHLVCRLFRTRAPSRVAVEASSLCVEGGLQWVLPSAGKEARPCSLLQPYPRIRVSDHSSSWTSSKVKERERGNQKSVTKWPPN